MTSGPPRPAAIVFDWDNTLVDTWPVIHEALAAALTAMGHDVWTLEETRRVVRKSLRDSFPEMFGNRWQDARKIFYETFEHVHIERLNPIEGAGEVLAALSRAGVHMAVLSNKTGKYLRAEADHLQWSAYFDCLVGAGDAEQDKPALESLHMALAHSPAPPGAGVWIVGDTDIDMEIAHRSGCLPVLMHRDPADSEFAAWPPHHCFSSCSGLLEYIAGW